MKGMKQPSIQPLRSSKQQWHKYLATIITFFLVALSIIWLEKPVLAQAESKSTPAISEFSTDNVTGRSVASLENMDAANEIMQQKANMNIAGVPPLPFVAPQVGPLIKNSYSDDIDKRTTAFIPHSLDNLTPIKMPQTKDKWIRVDLSEQTVVAYQGKKAIRAFIISSGLPGTPTVTGEFHIRTKVTSQTMTGGTGSMYYNLPGVKWVQYFYQDYGFHGTYWHNNFGRPMSHGCINMTDADAKWLFDWAGPVWDGESSWYRSTDDNPGTRVIVHG